MPEHKPWSKELEKRTHKTIFPPIIEFIDGPVPILISNAVKQIGEAVHRHLWRTWRRRCDRRGVELVLVGVIVKVKYMSDVSCCREARGAKPEVLLEWTCRPGCCQRASTTTVSRYHAVLLAPTFLGYAMLSVFYFCYSFFVHLFHLIPRDP